MGENGCGKSSVLKAIGLLLASSEALPDLLGLPDQWIRTGEREAELKAVISTMEGEERNVSLRLLRGDGRDMVIKRNEQGLRELDNALRHSSDRNYFIAGYGAFRRPPDSESRRHLLSGRSGPLGSLFSAAQELVSLEQWAMDLDYRSKGSSGIKIIAEALNQLLPGMTFKHIDKSARSIIMATDDGDVPLRQLSEGYQTMAAWAGDLLFRMTETFRHAVAIDEKRCFFRQNLWNPIHPNLKEVWFAGVHSDIGGGYDPTESQLALVAFRWMMAEAIANGVHVDQARYRAELFRCRCGGAGSPWRTA